MLNGKLAESPSELLHLGWRAYQTRRYVLAESLYREALQREPALAISRETQHSYNAACCAVLAAGGEGYDSVQVDEKTKSELLIRAYDWLQSELDRWRESLSDLTAEHRQIVKSTFEHWKKDSDLSTVRDPDELDWLAAEQRQLWVTLWEEVDRLLAEAGSTGAIVDN